MWACEQKGVCVYIYIYIYIYYALGVATCIPPTVCFASNRESQWYYISYVLELIDLYQLHIDLSIINVTLWYVIVLLLVINKNN